MVEAVVLQELLRPTGGNVKVSSRFLFLDNAPRLCYYSDMLKLTTKHTIYEVWCEWTSESVFVDHEPSTDELKEIRKKEWPGTDSWGMEYQLQVFKLDHFYTNTDKDKRGKK